jgi:hypothetical protein
MSTELVLAKKPSAGSETAVITSMLIKSLTHSALKELCYASNLYTTSDIIKQKEQALELEQLEKDNSRLELELKTEQEKTTELETKLKTKQKEYDTMFGCGVQLQNEHNELIKQFNFLHSENVKLIDTLKQENEILRKERSNKRIRTDD